MIETQNLIEREDDFTGFPALGSTRPIGKTKPKYWMVIGGIIGLAMLVTAIVLLATEKPKVDPNAPRMTIQVTGMHCPIQCGMRVSAALETLPWVIPGSITANTSTGEVIFAVTDRQAVDQSEIQRVIERSGFGIR